jgi:hypothetical protein
MNNSLEKQSKVNKLDTAKAKSLLVGYKNSESKKNLVLRRINKKVTCFSMKQAADYISSIASNQTISQLLSHSDLKKDQFYNARLKDMSLKLSLSSLISYIKNNKEHIENFYRLKHSIEEGIITGEYSKAEKDIGKIEEIFGASVWLIDAKLALYAKSDEKKMLGVHKQYFKNPEAGHITELLYNRMASKSIDSFLKHTFNDLITDYKNNDNHEYADLLSVILIPTYFKNDICISGLLNLRVELNPIDRLYIYEKILPIVVDSENFEGRDIFIDGCIEIGNILDNTEWKFYSEILSKQEISERMDQSLEEIIRDYSLGDYTSALRKSLKRLRTSPADITIIDIASRCTVFLEDQKHIGSPDSILVNGIHAAMCQLLTSSIDYDVSVSMLETLALKLTCFNISNGILALINSSHPYQTTSTLKKSCLQLGFSRLSITPKYTTGIRDRKDSKIYKKHFLDKENLSKNRKYRREFIDEVEKENIDHKKIKKLLSKIKEQPDILPSDYYYLWSESKIKESNYLELIREISTNYISDPNSHIYFPILKTVDLIKDYNLFSNIDAVICYYIYFRHYDFTKKEEASEAIEDFLIENKMSRPSEAKVQDTNDISKVEFFLKYICTTEMISILVDITTDKDLLIERLKIISLLNKILPEEDIELAEEEQDILTKLVSNKVRSKHSGNKVYIDSTGLKKSKIADYKSYLEIIEEFNIIDSQDLETDMEKLKKSIYGNIVEDFIFNENHGLVRYLSSEIRHGTLPNQIRSAVEANNLITVKGKSGSYEENTYWRDKYDLSVDTNYILNIENDLAWFSNECDLLIERTNQWPTASIFPNDFENSAFQFDIDNDYDELFDNLKKGIDPDLFFDYCEEFIWTRIDLGLQRVIKILNTETREDFRSLFKELSSRVTENRSVQLQELTRTINKTSNLVNEEITIISSWFKRPSKQELVDARLSEILTSTSDIVKGIFKPKKIIINNNFRCDAELNNNQALALTSALVTLCQNAIRHGRPSDVSSFSISAERIQGKTQISVENEIDDVKKIEIDDKDIVNRVSSFSQVEDKHLLTTEGGTGLYKAYRLITDTFENSSFSVLKNDLSFIQVISIGEDNETINS